jgi:hypothetical protein
MFRKPIVLLVMLVVLLPGLATAVTERDLEAHAARQLINSCSFRHPVDHRHHVCGHGGVMGPVGHAGN